MYLSFYKLKYEPFRLTPDPRFFCLAAPHRAALSAMLEGIIRRKGLMVLTGPIGTGKTSVVNAMLLLAKKLPSPYASATAYITNPPLNREEFLEMLLNEFEVSPLPASRVQRLLALHQFLLRSQQQGRTSVLVLDEAHLLSPELLEEVRLLCNMDTHREPLLQVVLSGQPELAATLLDAKLKALRQRIVIVRQLRSLTLDETRAYVQGRLEAGHLEGPAPFTPTATLQVYMVTQGVPRLINLVCDNALVIGYNMRAMEIGPEIIEQAAKELVFEPPTLLPPNVLKNAAPS